MSTINFRYLPFSRPNDNLQPRRRAFSKRSRQGCANCKRKHVKCDETLPACLNCVKSRLDCTRIAAKESKLQPSSAMSINPDWEQLEKRKFSDFAFATAPFIGEALDQTFWTGSLLPIAHTEKGTFNALLACAELHAIPSTDLMLLKQHSVRQGLRDTYKNAIKWYSRSVELSLQAVNSGTDIPTMLLGSVIYLYNENRLGNNTNDLLKSTFAFIHKSREITAMKDAITLASLVQLLRSLSYGCSDSAIVLSEHRNTAMLHAMRIAAELGTSEDFLLRMEFTSLTFDLADILSSNDETLAADFEERVGSWKARQRKHSESLGGEQFCLVSWQLYQVQWQVYQFGIHSSRILIEHCLDALLRKVEGTIWFVKATANPFLPLLDMDVIPMCIYVAWYWRTEPTLIRIRSMLDDYPFQLDLVREFLNYIEELVKMDYSEATPLELELFGGKPEIFQVWHAFRCTSQLAYLTSKLQAKE